MLSRLNSAVWVVAVALLAAPVLACLVPSDVRASSQASGASVKSSVILVNQGETSVVPGNEGKNDFYALKILSFDLPYDVSRVYTLVPFAAHNISVWSGTNTFGSSQYGAETAGAHSGQFFIDVPSSHPRTSNYSVSAATLSDFSAVGSQLSNLNYSSDALRLMNESSVGTYLSPDIPISSAVSVKALSLSLNGDSIGNITSHVSTDGGATWWSVANSTPLNVTSTGTTMKVMLEFTGNASLGYDTALRSFQLNSTYLQLTTVFTVHVSYVWTSEFVDGKTTVDLSEALPFSENGSYVIMLYTMLGYGAAGGGVLLELDANRSMNTYDDKDLYLGTAHPNGLAAYTAEIIAPSNNLVLYTVIAVFAVAAIGGFAYMRYRTKRPEEEEAQKTSVAQTKIDPAEAEARRRELVEQKKALLAEIEGIKKKLAAKQIDQSEASSELSRIKREFKGVRNELNRLSRKDISAVAESKPSSGYESVLASLARIDEDFEKGRLPENAYKTIRKEYVQKAAALMAAQSVAEKANQSPLTKEKDKLMEAIVALDEERERGEIDDRVYSDLRASYRKQLADLMMRAEVSKEEGGTE